MNILFVTCIALSIIASAAASFICVWCCCSRHTHLRKDGDSIKDLKLPGSNNFDKRDLEEIRKNNDLTRIKVFGSVAYIAGHVGFFQALYGTTLTLFIIGVIAIFAFLAFAAWHMIKFWCDA